MDPDLEKKLRDALEVGFEMRKAQKLYFSERTKTNLVSAKTLEGAFDRRLAELADIATSANKEV